jgi:hypothetical protein
MSTTFPVGSGDGYGDGYGGGYGYGGGTITLARDRRRL